MFGLGQKVLSRLAFKGGMASNPKMEHVPGFSLHFPKEISYGYLRFEGNGKILLGR